ncbi:MAG: hypothetical protein JXQ96_10805 [Cyclobacteriaceae bacterium]
MKTNNAHSFHIPVMGIGYTLDTPIKVAHLGISSVVSLVDDMLIERMRRLYAEKYSFPYVAISRKTPDARAKRITAYLNLMSEIVKARVKDLSSKFIEKSSELSKYISLLPDTSCLKIEFGKLISDNVSSEKVADWVKKNLPVGSIDVNIMTKLDKESSQKSEQSSTENNDAHSALRGFANSNLSSSVVLSAGMNPRLYSYMEKFDDFYFDQNGIQKKKIIIKVSDYRSALIQGKFFAKKGIWVSEYRIESGLNCGGHAFATDGHLLGPVLKDFKTNKLTLREELINILSKALEAKDLPLPADIPKIRISAQGGVGTAAEHNFLLKEYELDSIGWGTPFLLVPEAVNVDVETRSLLKDAEEEDLYLSNVSPLGIPFNNLKNNSQDVLKGKRVEKGKPGSPCVKKYASLNKEFTENVICIASRQYQSKKIEELKNQSLDVEQYEKEHKQIVEKACICVGLGVSTLKANNLDTKFEGSGVSICPGPNLAYFSKVVSLKDMVDHIYGKSNVMVRTDRPNLFMKELGMYVDHFKSQVDKLVVPITARHEKQLEAFRQNVFDGIAYYQEIFGELIDQVERDQNGLTKMKAELADFSLS